MFLMLCIKFHIDYHNRKLADVLEFIEVLAGNLSCSIIYGYMLATNAISFQVNSGLQFSPSHGAASFRMLAGSWSDNIILLLLFYIILTLYFIRCHVMLLFSVRGTS